MEKCPCASGLGYAACCRPFHRREREALDAVALMRSRFAGFAKKESSYLVATLHPDHEDKKQLSEAQILASIRDTSRDFRYLDLAILDRSDFDATGTARVLFFAKVFSQGKDFSFVELSEFRRDGDAIRYVRGDAKPMRGEHERARALNFGTWASMTSGSATPT